MYSDMKGTVCQMCEGTNFMLLDGFYYCKNCHTRVENIRQQVVEADFEAKVRKTKVRVNKDKDAIEGFTTWEIYNVVLIGLTDELIQLGASAKIKLTVLQLWARFLGKLEIAFTSTVTRKIPKLTANYNKKDSEIIYGRIQMLKRKRVKKRKKMNDGTSSAGASGTSFTTATSVSSRREMKRQQKLLVKAECNRYLSQSSIDGLSETNQSLDSLQSSRSKRSYASSIQRFNKETKKRIREKKIYSKRGKNRKEAWAKFKRNSSGNQMHLTPKHIIGILYLALRIHDEKINLGDILRFAREGHLSYNKLDTLFPEANDDRDVMAHNFPKVDLVHHKLRLIAAKLAKFLDVYVFAKPDLQELIQRYCIELQLPNGIMLYATRVLTLSNPQMKFNTAKRLIPNYEGRAMAIIIFVLKLLFSFDGVTEFEISKLAEELNRISFKKNVLDSTLFSFREWQRYIECRKTVLSLHHFPTKFKFRPDDPDNGSFYKFLNSLRPQRAANKKKWSGDYHNVVNILESCIQTFDDHQWFDNNPEQIADEYFPASLTPMNSYLQQLLQNPSYELNELLRVNFVETKVGYLTKPKKLLDLAAECDIILDVVETNVNFVEKIVPQYETPRQCQKALKETVSVTGEFESFRDFNKTESLFELQHKKITSILNIDQEKQQIYESMKSTENDCDDDFCFNDININGQLIFPDNARFNSDSDSDSEKEPIKENCFKLSAEEEKSVWDKKINSLHRRQFGTEALIRLSENGLIEEEETIEEKSSQNENNNDSKNEIEEDMIFDILEDNLNDPNSFTVNMNFDKFENYKLFFKPHKNYWMYHYFSRMNRKSFQLFSKDFPDSFRWLLNECASVIEMSVDELYDELCLVETYYTYALQKKTKLIDRNKSREYFGDSKIRKFW